MADPYPAFYLIADPDPWVRLCRHRKVNFYMKNILYVGNRSYLNVGTKGFFERLEIRFVGKYWSISLLLDPDPHSQYGTGCRRAKSMRFQADPDPQHCYRHCCTFMSLIDISGRQMIHEYRKHYTFYKM
jgi:hypothetical protein